MSDFRDADFSAHNGGLPPLPPELDPRGKHRTSRRARPAGGAAAALGPARLIGRVLCAALSVFLVAYIGYLWKSVHNIDNRVTHLKIGAIDNPKNANGQKLYDVDGKDQNLLIVGNDDRRDMTKAERNKLHTGSGDGSLSTDTMMIVHVPADGSRATLISLPRDSYVSIPGHDMYKLNAAYAYGYNDSSGGRKAKIAAGADLLIQTVQNLTSLRIDHFVQVGLIGFYRISNAIGGVEVNLCNAVDDTVAHNLSIGDNGGSGLVLSKGKHTIKGVQALEFVRQRHGLAGSDLDRVQRQRYFLTAAFRKVASAGILLNPGRLGDLVDAVDQSLYVDSGLKILNLAKQMSNLSANNIIGKTIPIVRDDPNTSAGDALIVDPAQVQAFVKSVIGTDSTAYKDAKTVDPNNVTLHVLNAGSNNGAATTATNVLNGVGFHASVGPESPAQQSTTTIEYPKGQESAAKTLAKYVPGASVEQSDVSIVTLMLGNDKRTAKSTPTSSKSSSSKSKASSAIDAHCIN